jgi:CubicO group peptidase (beta-lactamase class C family)
MRKADSPRAADSATFACMILPLFNTPLRRAVIVTALTLFAFTDRVHAQSIQRIADSLMAAYASPEGPGASLLVVHDGRVEYMKGYGMAAVDTRTPVGAGTNFRLASLSKQFTATAIMLLEADGKLRYDDDITTLLPNLPSFAHGVTVRNLLNHTSGLPDYEDFVPDTQTVQVHDADIPALIARAAAPKFAAGTKYDYSNTGYGLLALIVERVSGRRYADFLRARIFAPLAMTNTVAHEEGRTVVAQRAYGHTIGQYGIRRTDQSNTSAVLGDGGIYSSVIDLAKWDRALEQHTLVSAAAQQIAWTPPSLPNGAKTEYGFGWFIDRDHGTMRLRHHGESRGFTNGIVRYPDKRVTVIILTNRTGGAPWDIAQKIAEVYLDPSTGGASAAWRP